MPGRYNTAVIFIFAVSVVVAASMAKEDVRLDSPAKPALRAPAALKRTEKIHGAVYVKIETLRPGPLQVGDTFVLRGEIRSEDGDLSGVDFEWSIPEGVRLVSGQVSGILPSLSEAQPRVVEITLAKTSARNEQVHLLAGAQRGSSHFADSAQFNTDIQEMLNADAAAVKSGLEVLRPKTKPIKVFQ